MSKALFSIFIGFCVSLLSFQFLLSQQSTIDLGSNESHGYIIDNDRGILLPSGQYSFKNDEYFEIKQGTTTHPAVLQANDWYYIQNIELNGEWFPAKSQVRVWASHPNQTIVVNIPSYKHVVSDWIFIVILGILAMFFTLVLIYPL